MQIMWSPAPVYSIYGNHNNAIHSGWGKTVKNRSPPSIESPSDRCSGSPLVSASTSKKPDSATLIANQTEMLRCQRMFDLA
jgi:hypothetical protein